VERSRSDVALESDLDDAALPALAVNDDPLAKLTEREGIAALRRAVQALPRRYREVVILCDLEEVDYADAAVALGCPIGTVRSRLHRARGLLLDRLDQERSPRQAMRGLRPVRCLT
jgi:RNA polymerase sigma-70 factor (ECF subfamily)